MKVKAGDAVLTYMGRVTKADSATIIYWSGSSVSMKFTGTTVTAELRDEKGLNYYYFIIDGKPGNKIKLDSQRHVYTLAQNLTAATHTIELFRLTEESAGRTWVYSFATDGKPAACARKQRSICFYGNSITAGYSVDDTAGDSKAPYFFNNYYTYAAITARHYDARYTNICKSGIGVMVSWFPIIMPELYDRVNPLDSSEKWDYEGDKTNVVVIDLFQNDSWLVNKPDHAQFKARFGSTKPTEQQIIDAYANFVRTVRSKHPGAAIVCTLGSMDATKDGSPWMDYVSAAAASLNDKRVFTCFFPYKNTPGHPKRKEQQAIADTLIHFIDKHIQW